MRERAGQEHAGTTAEAGTPAGSWDVRGQQTDSRLWGEEGPGGEYQTLRLQSPKLQSHLGTHTSSSGPQHVQASSADPGDEDSWKGGQDLEGKDGF